MAWTKRTIAVLYEHIVNDEIKYKFEIIRSEDGNGKHMEAGFFKIYYWKKDGVITRGGADGLFKRDLDWRDANRAKIDELLAAKHDAIGMTPKPAPVDDAVEDVPF